LGVIDYDGEDEAYDGDELAPTLPLYRRRRFIVGMIIVALGFSTTLAANISLNGNKKTEFGQGLYLIKACDQWISVGLVPDNVISSPTTGWPSIPAGTDTPTYTAGSASKVKQIVLYGLDTVKCRGTNIKMQLYHGTYAQPIPIFTDGNGTSNRVIFNIPNNATATFADRESNVNFINNYGAIIGSPNWDDGYEALYASGTAATYTIAFTQPLAMVPDISRVTFESAPNS
jgi:hypothetical protein